MPPFRACTACARESPDPTLSLFQNEDGDGEESGLFHARVLLVEADRKSAKKAKEMLEQAGYMVTVESDGKQVKPTDARAPGRGSEPLCAEGERGGSKGALSLT